MKSVVFVLMLALTAFPLYAQQVAEGRVYCDVNNNGRHDRGEQYLEGIGVTNGVDVVMTDKAGRYQLPIDGEATIAVIKPAHYQLQLDVYNKPRFYYQHRPQGTPRRESYKGLPPTGNLPASIDFGLLPRQEPEKFCVAVLGDPQPHFIDHIRYFGKAIVDDLLRSRRNVSFGISLGDVNDENFELFNPYLAQVARVGVPWYHLMGNHDTDYEARTDREADDAFETFVGPVNYAFNYADAHFLILDNILFPDPRPGRQNSPKAYWGGFRDDQKEFIRNDLKWVDKEKLVVVAFHIPMLDENAVRKEDKEFLFECLKGFPHVLLLSAHLHRQNQYFHTEEDGWKGGKPLHEFNAGAACGDFYSGYLDKDSIPCSMMSDGTPKGYAFLEVDGNTYSIDYKVAGKPEDYALSVQLPKQVVYNRYTPAYITVNFFMGTKSDEVLCRIDGGEWKRMKYEEVTDPDHDYMVQCWNRDEAPKLARWPAPSCPSTHIWRIRIPSSLPVGTHRVEIQAIDMFGQKYCGQACYEVVNALRMYP